MLIREAEHLAAWFFLSFSAKCGIVHRFHPRFKQFVAILGITRVKGLRGSLYTYGRMTHVHYRRYFQNTAKIIERRSRHEIFFFSYVHSLFVCFQLLSICSCVSSKRHFSGCIATSRNVSIEIPLNVALRLLSCLLRNIAELCEKRSKRITASACSYLTCLFYSRMTPLLETSSISCALVNRILESSWAKSEMNGTTGHST